MIVLENRGGGNGNASQNRVFRWKSDFANDFVNEVLGSGMCPIEEGEENDRGRMKIYPFIGGLRRNIPINGLGGVEPSRKPV